MTIALTSLSAATYVATGKTLPGHAMSMSTDQDCVVMRNLKGEPMCKDVPIGGGLIDPSLEMACYRSIANISCYQAENPNETATRRVQ